ncbi:isocitrate lyase/PEP mutase family protein [Vreelandella malpeensis]|uniref:Oxaloacetate decarboxylase n=1 Tax=Vreelandella malpeensis TaxID=1172368 RepID=A0ABS8DRZ8_9GAMM|nr:oxaloacetate decarboxylase [Halomonas malpeensis]MCB8889051.1 oxaloacetate decarboxylase [Halomonas malpeensis]
MKRRHTASHTPSNLKGYLQDPSIVVAPGVYDALGASLAEQAGFDTVYLSGASLAYTQLGRPDIGLLSITEITSAMSHIRERTNLSVVVDCDTGFGNAMNVMRSVNFLERAGANAIQLEDQTYPKRCGHLRGKTLVSQGEMVGKLKAALDARESENTLIIGRTDAVAVEGTDRALDRAQAYHEAGVDMLFIEGIRTDEDIEKIMARFKGKVPIMANMVEGGDTPLQNAQALEALGFSLVIFPGALVRAFTHMASRFFATLKQEGSTDAFREQMLDFKQLNDYLGTQALLELGQQYDER